MVHAEAEGIRWNPQGLRLAPGLLPALEHHAVLRHLRAGVAGDIGGAEHRAVGQGRQHDRSRLLLLALGAEAADPAVAPGAALAHRQGFEPAAGHPEAQPAIVTAAADQLVAGAGQQGVHRLQAAGHEVGALASNLVGIGVLDQVKLVAGIRGEQLAIAQAHEQRQFIAVGLTDGLQP